MPIEDAGRLSTSSAQFMGQRRRGRRKEVDNTRLTEDRAESCLPTSTFAVTTLERSNFIYEIIMLLKYVHKFNSQVEGPFHGQTQMMHMSRFLFA